MKMVTNLFAIGLIALFLSINSSLSFAQVKGNTLKKGAVYIGNVTSPQQIAAYGTPAWLFSTMSIAFVDDKCALTFNRCAYSINMYTGGLGSAMYSQTSESMQAAYLVKNGSVYIWDSTEGKPKDDAGYLLVFKINSNELLTLTKASINGLDFGRYVYMSDYYSMNKMSESELQNIEIVALTKLLGH